MNVQWNKFEEPKPYVGVLGFAFDIKGRFPILHRSDKVRSAKNAWSFISGLHECGRTLFEQFSEEAREECNITTSVVGEKIGYFEAIIKEENWHWVMCMVACPCPNFNNFKNMEPQY